MTPAAPVMTTRFPANSMSIKLLAVAILHAHENEERDNRTTNHIVRRRKLAMRCGNEVSRDHRCRSPKQCDSDVIANGERTVANAGREDLGQCRRTRCRKERFE